MGRLPTMLSVLWLTCLLSSGEAQEPFHFGVNGHPGVQEGYKQIPIKTQLDLVKELGADWYRCDWNQSELETDPEFYDRLVNAAAEQRIRILPVIFPSTNLQTDATLEQIRRDSFDFAKNLVARYQGKITHWELDNELEIPAMIRKGERTRTGLLWKWGDPDGSKPEHYEENRYQRARAELIGLCEGVKAADPKALTIINAAGWLHYGFFQRLIKEDQVPFDILGWHWYSKMGDMTKVEGSINVLEQLKGFGKPIWITEVNRSDGSLGGNEAEQAEYLSGVVREMRDYPGVEALFVYELFDEPYFGPDNGASHYGLVKLTKDKNGMWQPAAKKPGFLRFSKNHAVRGN